ncbi:bone morphogenetic protein 15 [Hippoglossus stenolepis]|uniref:bone morphogenetic protein 15 n=1 Tax=Hippoglossus stenolepis TaxID=195615 RepID=UPI001FAF2E56|nr:bone morphogenetic protein 15 [Hippoglossus stenolepis]
MSNMRTTRTKHGLLRACVLSCFVVSLLCSTCSGVLSGRDAASRQPGPRRSRRGLSSPKQVGAQHRTTDEQRGDQNVQFMLSLYRSAAEPDGRPKQHRKFGSNTVRLLRASASTVHYQPAARDHHYTFTVQYHLDTLPSEQLIRASFIHLRSSSPPSSSSLPSSSSSPPSSSQAPEPLRCRAQIPSLGPGSQVTLEPHEQWTETDITAHVMGHFLQRKDQDAGGPLTLTAQYWCTEPWLAGEDSGPWWWWRSRLRGQRREEAHLEVPSLLLYLEEGREGKDWMAELLGAEGRNIMRQIGRWHPSVRRRRRSKDSSSESKDPLLDVLRNAPTSSSSSSFPSLPSASIASDIPNYKRKTIMPKNRCKLHSFRLSFDELGWGHYFIAPPVYNPRFCQGDCPRLLPSEFHSPNHAIIQTLINDLGIGDVPPLSCVPCKYMPMSVLVVHKKKVEYKEFEDMVAKSCTCR